MRFNNLLLVAALQLFVVFGPLMGQSKGKIYFVDSTLAEGQIYFNKKEPFKVGLRKDKGDIISHTGDVVRAFFPGGDLHYVSRSAVIDGQVTYLFLEVLESGVVSLFRTYLGDEVFFVEREKLIRLDRDNFKTELSKLHPSCPEWSGYIANLKYSAPALKNAVRAINDGYCKKLPFVHYGLSVGLMNVNALLAPQSFTRARPYYGDFAMSSKVPVIRFFYEKPFWRTRKLSGTIEGAFASTTVIEEKLGGEVNQDIRIDMKTIMLTSGTKYDLAYLSKGNIYLCAGLEFDINFDAGSEIFVADIDDDIVVFDKYVDDLKISQQLFGIYYGVGIQFYVTKKNYLGFELRSAHLRNLFDSNKIDFDNQQLTLKISL